MSDDDELPPIGGMEGAHPPLDDGGVRPPQDALDRAAQAWERRGYEVWYRDDHLIQLVRRSLPAGVALLLVLSCLLAILGAMLAARRLRSWVVVSLARSPDGRIVTHRQRAPRPPSR